MASTSRSQDELLELDDLRDHSESQPRPEHTIFLSHSGAQKAFVEQLCEDLKSRGQSAFFNESTESLPKAEVFASHILEAAKQCVVAVVVLSPEFLQSKWCMLELATLVAAQRTCNPNLKLFPLFYKLEVAELKDTEGMVRKWEEMAVVDARIHLEVWKEVVRVLGWSTGAVFSEYGGSEVNYRKAIVDAVCTVCQSFVEGRVPSMVGRDQLCNLSAFCEMHEERDPLVRELSSMELQASSAESQASLIKLEAQSTFRGIHKVHQEKRWSTKIRTNSKRGSNVWLGTYNTAEEAASAFDAGIFYYNRHIAYNFRDSQTYLPPLDRNMNERRQLHFIKTQARILAKRMKNKLQAQIPAKRMKDEVQARILAKMNRDELLGMEATAMRDHMNAGTSHLFRSTDTTESCMTTAHPSRLDNLLFLPLKEEMNEQLCSLTPQKEGTKEILYPISGGDILHRYVHFDDFFDLELPSQLEMVS